MNFTAIGIATAVVAVVGLVLGALLSFFGEKFKVVVDPKEEAIRELLPSNNCGGCGYPGCDGLAKAIAEGKAPVTACPVGGPELADKIAAVMGVEAGEATRMVAFVRCAGTCTKTRDNYYYYGPKDCRLAFLSPGHGTKKCYWGCCGFGTCAEVCPFDAIRIVDGLAVVDKEKCRGCRKCLEACPGGLIQMIPYDTKYAVICASKSKGKDVRVACEEGCIGCKKCVPVCETGAISVIHNLARIDQTKCDGCGKCAEACPTKIIRVK